MGDVTKALFGGSSSSSKSSSRLDPDFKEAFLDNLGRSRRIARNLEAREIADFGQDYYTGASNIRDYMNNNTGRSTVSSGIDTAKTVAGFTPQNVTAREITGQGYDATTGDASLVNRSDIRDVDGGSFLNMNLNEYMNPYLDLVAGNTVTEMDRARQIAQMGNADRAAAAKAFGGSRQGVLEAETNRGYFDTLGQNLAKLYTSGYDAATNLAGADLDRGYNAQVANQGVDLSVAEANAGRGQDMTLANMEAENASRIYGAEAINAAAAANRDAALKADLANLEASLLGNDQRLDAAKTLADMGLLDQNMMLQGNEALVNLGLSEQGLTQSQLDAIRNLPLEQQAIINEALGINVGGGSGTVSRGSSSSNSYNGIFKPMEFPT